MFKEKSWKEELTNYLSSEEYTAKAKIWSVAIGMQDVDGLVISKYLIKLIKENIENNITTDEVKKKIDKYYKWKKLSIADERSEEADKVSVRIVEELNSNQFKFSKDELLHIHGKIFLNSLPNAGEYRSYNIFKNEAVLDGDTVQYSSYENIGKKLNDYFKKEKNFNYVNLKTDGAIEHLCNFIADIWKVHPFCEGNTRTLAIFLIKYVKSLGFSVNISAFIENSMYFRNALVRATYDNEENNIQAEKIYLKNFLYNLICDSNIELKNENLYI